MDYSEYDTPARLKWGLRAFFVWCKKRSKKAALEALACELEGVDPVNPIVANGERLALQQARLEYYAQAVRLREANPALLELPPITQDNSHGDLVALERWCGDVKPELPATPPAPPPDGGETPAGANGQDAVLSKEGKALAALADHPDWTDEQIAQAAGCSRGSLFRMEKFVKTKRILKQGKDLIPHGSKKRRNGDEAASTVEAWDGDNE